jgi:hypothetical protein
MTHNLNVSVLGGAASIGNIVQGDNNQARTNMSTEVADQAFNKTQCEISELGCQLKLPTNQINEVVQNLEKLKEEVKSTTPVPEKGISIIKTIRENYTWAYPLIKDFISVAWPALLPLIRA